MRYIWMLLMAPLQLIPLYVCLGAGVFGAGFYLLRLAVKNPEVTWNRSKNPEPWNEYTHKQYKVRVMAIITEISSEAECRFSVMYNIESLILPWIGSPSWCRPRKGWMLKMKSFINSSFMKNLCYEGLLDFEWMESSMSDGRMSRFWMQALL